MSYFNNPEVRDSYNRFINRELASKLNFGSFIKIKLLFKKINVKTYSDSSQIRSDDYCFEDLQKNLYSSDGSRIIFIHGPYGAGKSTLILKLVEQNLLSYDENQKVFLQCDLSKIEPSVSDLLKKIRLHPKNGRALLLKEILKCSDIDEERLTLNSITDIYNDIKKGRLIILLDAFDEGLLAETLSTVKQFTMTLFENLISKDDDNHSKIVITNRSEWNINTFIPSLALINNCAANYVETIDVVQLLTLNYWNIEEYINSYYNINYKINQKFNVGFWLKNISNSFWAGDLAKNPMHLNMLCSLDTDIITELEGQTTKRSKYELFEKYIAKLLKRNKSTLNKYLIDLAKECMISGKLYISKNIGEKWNEYDLSKTRKLPILRCEERMIKKNQYKYRVGFYHKSFLDYFFAKAVKESLNDDDRDLFDKIELDINARDFLVDILGEGSYIKQTRVGWGLPFDDTHISLNSKYRKEVSNHHIEIVKAVLKPNDVSFEQWLMIEDLISKCSDYEIIVLEPLLIRSLRYGLVVLKQIHEKVTNWDSKENNEACLLINELIYKYFFLIIELRKNKFQNFTSNLLEIESLPAVKFYLEEEINLLASTTLKSLLNHLYSTRVSVEYAKRMYDLIKMPFKTKIIPDKLSISNIDDYLIGFKDETIKSLDLIINSH